MKTKNVAGKGVSVELNKRVAVAAGVFMAFVAAVASVLMMWPTSPGPAVVVAVPTVVAVVAYLRAFTRSVARKRSVREACNWHLAEEHIFLDGQPFSLALNEQHS